MTELSQRINLYLFTNGYTGNPNEFVDYMDSVNDVLITRSVIRWGREGQDAPLEGMRNVYSFHIMEVFENNVDELAKAIIKIDHGVTKMPEATEAAEKIFASIRSAITSGLGHNVLSKQYARLVEENKQYTQDGPLADWELELLNAGRTIDGAEFDFSFANGAEMSRHERDQLDLSLRKIAEHSQHQ